MVRSLVGAVMLLAGANQVTNAAAVSADAWSGPRVAPVHRVQATQGTRVVRCAYYSYGFALYHRFDGMTVYSIVTMGTAEETALTDEASIIRYLDELKADAERYCAAEVRAGRLKTKLTNAAQRIDLIGPSGRGFSAFLAPESRTWKWMATR